MPKSYIPKKNLEMKSLNEGIVDYLREVFEDSIDELSKITEVGVLAAGKKADYRYMIGGILSRFLYRLKFNDFEHAVFLLLDLVDLRTVGIQAGVILESAVPRGALVLPNLIYPLELALEEKRNHVNPFYSILEREKENSTASIFFQSFNLSAGTDKYKKPSMLPAGPYSGPYSHGVKILYPNYLVIYPIESKTIVMLSRSTPSHKKLEKNYRGKKGEYLSVKFRLPKDKVLKKLLPMVMEAKTRITKNQCDYAVQSKKPELVPLFEYLVNVAGNEDLMNNGEVIREVFRETLDSKTRIDQTLRRNTPFPDFEVSLLPSVRESFTSRYGPKSVKCPKCSAKYNFTYDMINPEGMVKCSNCLNEFHGIDMSPNL